MKGGVGDAYRNGEGGFGLRFGTHTAVVSKSWDRR